MDTIYLLFNGVGVNGNALAKAEFNPVLKPQYDNAHHIFGGKDEVFLIENVRTTQNKPLITYSYLRCNGVIDTSGRPKSFVSVIIATDTFCPDYMMMFSLCRDIFYQSVIGGKLLSLGPNGAISWLCNSFEDPYAITIHRQAEDRLVNILTAYKQNGMLKDTPIAGWAVSPGLDANNQDRLIVKMNPSDVTDSELENILKSGKKVAIAADYPPKSAQRAIEQANNAQKEAERHAASLASSLEQSRNEVSRLSLEKSGLSKELTETKKQANDLTKQLKDEKERQKTLLSKYEAKGNYSCQQQLNILIDKITSLPGNSNPQPKPKRFKLMILVASCAAIVLCALAFFLGRLTNGDTPDSISDKGNTDVVSQQANKGDVKTGQHKVESTLESKYKGFGNESEGMDITKEKMDENRDNQINSEGNDSDSD